MPGRSPVRFWPWRSIQRRRLRRYCARQRLCSWPAARYARQRRHAPMEISAVRRTKCPVHTYNHSAARPRRYRVSLKPGARARRRLAPSTDARPGGEVERVIFGTHSLARYIDERDALRDRSADARHLRGLHQISCALDAQAAIGLLRSRVARGARRAGQAVS